MEIRNNLLAYEASHAINDWLTNDNPSRDEVMKIIHPLSLALLKALGKFGLANARAQLNMMSYLASDFSEPEEDECPNPPIKPKRKRKAA